MRMNQILTISFSFKRIKSSSFYKKIKNNKFLNKFFSWRIWKPILIHGGLSICLYIGLIAYMKNHLDDITNHGEKINLPSLIGKNANDAKNIINKLGLRPQITDSIYDPQKPNGTVLVQFPLKTKKTNVFVKSGRVISLRVSKKKKFVVVPDLVQKTIRYAEVLLKSRELKYEIRKKPVNPELAGIIVEQIYRGKKVAEGTRLLAGSKIIIYQGEGVVEPDVLIPNFYGVTIPQAKIMLENIGFNYIIACPDCVTSADSLSARVSHQNPEYFQGHRVSKSRSITIYAKRDFVIENKNGLIEENELDNLNQ